MAQDTFFSSKKTLNIGGNMMSLETPIVMGILNITPDSFYASSRVSGEDNLFARAEKMIEEGASILDIGGYSSRPGATNITLEEELGRVIPVIKSIKAAFPKTPVSIDTFRYRVAEKALEAGADIINDISAGELDDQMFELVSNSNVPYIIMHMKGNPQTMKSLAKYDNLILEVMDYFQKKIKELKDKGVADIIIDPGFGFAKDIDQNFLLLKKLSEFKLLEVPILVGVSRKSMIYKPLNIDPEHSLNGTTALHMVALINGASILRVHDVKEAVETIKLYNLTYIK